MEVCRFHAVNVEAGVLKESVENDPILNSLYTFSLAQIWCGKFSGGS